MPATGRDLTRRALLAAAAGARWSRAADPSQDTWEVLTGMAAALGRASAGEFLAACERALPGYETLRTNVEALIVAAEVESGIDPISNEGDAQTRALEVDWSLHLVDRTGLGHVTRRNQNVKCRMEKRGRKWMVVALDPIVFFAPPSA